MEINYAQLRLKVGLEIHQQLATAAKLFCNCPPELFKENPEIVFLRRLRPTQSELGQIDPAAYFEFQKGVKIRYEANRATACLVEMDEEPPHQLNMEAVETVLMTALMMNAKPVDEIHVMRKTVIDGSNTTGFQRTCVVALDGYMQVDGKNIPIQHASLEEDAARKIGDEESGKIIRYRIDRLGIPLIEVATGPAINSPDEAQKVAFAIGRILRDTGRVMRGLGTIRQDLNVSIPDGALVEIKGVQKLELISKVVEYEVKRQLNLLKIHEELNKKGINPEDIIEDFVDVTDIFKQTKCQVIRKALEKHKCVRAVRLPKFAGFLKQELMPDFRFGTELADRARFWGRVGGVFHTDELPAYGVTVGEVEKLRKTLNASTIDAIVFVADTPDNVEDALRAVVERAREAIAGVPAETRAANPDGTTKYMRPRPGAARMYPETDIPPVPITATLIERTRKNLPEPAEKRLTRLMNTFKLNKKLAEQIVNSEYGELFEIISKESGVSATIVAAFLTETLKSLKRDEISIEEVTDDQLKELFGLIGSGELAKEAATEVVTWLSENESESVKEAVTKLGLEMLSENEIAGVIDRIVAENKQSVNKLGKKAFGLLMGLVMKKIRGKANPDLVGKLLKERLS